MGKRIVETLTWIMMLALLCYTCYGIGRTVTVVKFADKITDIIFEEVQKKEFISIEEVE